MGTDAIGSVAILMMRRWIIMGSIGIWGRIRLRVAGRGIMGLVVSLICRIMSGELRLKFFGVDAIVIRLKDCYFSR